MMFRTKQVLSGALHFSFLYTFIIIIIIGLEIHRYSQNEQLIVLHTGYMHFIASLLEIYFQ